MELVAAAKQELGVEQTTQAIHEALASVVRRGRVQRLLREDFPVGSLEELFDERRDDPAEDLG